MVQRLKMTCPGPHRWLVAKLQSLICSQLTSSYMAKTVTLFLVWFLDRLSSLENKNIINEGKKKKKECADEVRYFSTIPGNRRAVGRCCLWSFSLSLLTHTLAQFAVLCGSFWYLEVSHPYCYVGLFCQQDSYLTKSNYTHKKKKENVHISSWE